MKFYITIILALLTYASVGQKMTAVDHMQALNQDVDQINRDTWDYIRQASRGRSASKVEKRRVELAQTIKSAKYRVSQVRSYQGDYSLKKSYGSYLNLSYIVINNDYKKIVDMERVAEETYDDMEAYILTKELVNAKMDSAFAVFKLARETYATKYNIVLTEGEGRISKKIKNAGDINIYANRIYLILYQSQWYENQMILAISENRIGDLEQFRQTLAATSSEGLEEIRSIGAYKSSSTLKTSCIYNLKFFQTEANDYIPSMISFFTLQDKVNTMKQNVESKKRNQLTNDEITAYNNAINELNNSINKFNSTNEYLNKTRSKKLDGFNKAMQNLYDEFL